jgi:hypothetical protein
MSVLDFNHLQNTVGNSETLADEATIVLPSSKQGIIFVFGDDEYMQCHIQIDGTVSLMQGSSNTAITDLDGNLCLYKNGDTATIKNRRGDTKTITYIFVCH